MKKIILCFVIPIIFLAVNAEGLDPEAIAQLSKAIAEGKLMNENEAGMQVEQPVYVSSSLGGMVKSGNSEGVGVVMGLNASDTSEVAVSSSNRHIFSTIANYPVGIILDTAIPKVGPLPGAGTLWGLGGTAKSMLDIWSVWTGRAEPEILRPIVPHAVQAWDSIKGIENLPSQTVMTWSFAHYDDLALRIDSYSIKSVHQTYTTTLPEKIGKYGYDWSTDKIFRQTATYTHRHETFSGSRFNKMYQDLNFKMHKMPPPVSPPSIYNYIPTNKMSSDILMRVPMTNIWKTPIPGYTPVIPSWTPKTPTYTPPIPRMPRVK